VALKVPLIAVLAGTELKKVFKLIFLEIGVPVGSSTMYNKSAPTGTAREASSVIFLSAII
jgi:hypothetical protein